MTKQEFSLLQRRIGFHNIYDPFSSVHYFELDLSHPEHREIVAHVVRLAVLEPGGERFEIARDLQKFKRWSACKLCDGSAKLFVMRCLILQIMSSMHGFAACDLRFPLDGANGCRRRDC